MPLLDEVRSSCAQIAAQARWVRIDMDAIADEQVLARIAAPAPGESPAALDPVRHYLEGEPADVADYLLALDAINFGSGWFPTLRKRLDGGLPLSGYFTVAWGLTDYVRAHHATDSGWTLDAAWLRAVDTRTIAEILEQPSYHELMSLYAMALRELGRFLGERRALDLVAECGGSAERLAQALACGMAMFDDRGFYKRAQIVAADLALAGVASFADLDRLTIFADNLVPHVLRCEGILAYDESLAARIDAGELLPAGGAEREIRACAVHACELISTRTGVPERVLDNRLWNRGQAARYKERPRHRCRCVYY
ncbi:MAG: queuosine salvage family protein [Solirubrobacterales bacterium]